MQRFLHSKDSVSICHKDNCIHAKGQNAELIAVGAFAMLLLIGIATLSKNIKKKRVGVKRPFLLTFKFFNHE